MNTRAVSFPRLRYTNKPFLDALTELLRRESGDPRSKINLTEFFKRVDGWKYETLRKQIASERTLQPEAIEAMAEALGVAPEYFQEYRQHQMQQAIAAHPDLVDLVYDLLMSRAKSLDAIAVPLISRVLDQLAERSNLDSDTASKVLELMMDGQVGDVQAAALLMGLRVKGETGEEIFGFARTMRSYGTPVHIETTAPLVDIVSTGGDRLATFNISTTAAFVAAGAGAKVAKYGSRGQTSFAGSADLIQALGARVDLSPDAIAECVQEVGIGFMFAPLHYKVIRHLVPLRRSLNMMTVFNFLGPILNPAGVKRQLSGVHDPRYLSVLAEALMRQGTEHALLVHGEDGLDEISIGTPTSVVEVRAGRVSDPFTVTPEMYGLSRWPLKDLVGGDPVKNAGITRRVLSGEAGAALDVVLLNAGAAIFLAGLAGSVGEGVGMARAAVNNGSAWDKMTAFVEFTQQAKTRADSVELQDRAAVSS
jgi:anthranilate phosphoribosyltransferase